MKTFIPPEQFASLLEAAYDDPVDYNFAIDGHGYMYPGFSTKPWQVEEKLRIDDPLQVTTGAVCKLRLAAKSSI